MVPKSEFLSNRDRGRRGTAHNVPLPRDASASRMPSTSNRQRTTEDNFGAEPLLPAEASTAQTRQSSATAALSRAVLASCSLKWMAPRPASAACHPATDLDGIVMTPPSFERSLQSLRSLPSGPPSGQGVIIMTFSPVTVIITP